MAVNDAETQRLLGSLVARMNATERWQCQTDEKLDETSKKLDEIVTSVSLIASREDDAKAAKARRINLAKWTIQITGITGIAAAFGWLQDHFRLW